MNEQEQDLDRLRVYEIGVQMASTLGDEGASVRFSDLKNRITSVGGVILQEGSPERIDLAYSISQIRDNKKTIFTEAYFAWVKFELDASLIKAIEEELSSDLSIIRYLAFKTVRANTYIPRKSPRRRSSRADDIVAEDESLPLPEIESTETDDDDSDIEDSSILDKKLDELTANDVE